MLPSLKNPRSADITFVENICQAILTHLVERYGGIFFASKNKGCLAPWQERWAAEFLVAHLDEPFSLVELANVCELSRSYFIKAFKESFRQNASPMADGLSRRPIEADVTRWGVAGRNCARLRLF